MKNNLENENFAHNLPAQIAEWLDNRRIYMDRWQGGARQIAIVRGQIIFIEVPMCGGKLTAEQSARHYELRASGAIVIVADSFDSFATQFSAIRAAVENNARKGEIYD